MREALKAIPIFKALADEDLDRIASHLRQISYAKGQTIFQQGDLGDAMYLVESGQVVVWNELENEAVAYLGRGSFVGEIALLLPEPRTASLKVALDADLYVLQKQDFDQLLNERPDIALHVTREMTRELSRRLLNTTQGRNEAKGRRISAVWADNDDYIGLTDLIRNIDHYVEQPIAIIPLAGCRLPDNLRTLSGLMILDDLEVSAETLAGALGVQVDVFGHIILLLPQKRSYIADRALNLADTVICIGSPPPWIANPISPEKLWQTDNKPNELSRLARRLTGFTVGLALSSGGGKGLAHLGVMKVLQEANIPIDIVAGTSAGAFFGILYALGRTPAQLDSFADEIQQFNKVHNWDFNFLPRAGVLKGSKAREIIASVVEHKRFEDLEIPFYCVAADVLTGEEVVFDSGDLADAIRASLSIPGIANPWHLGERFLIDGAFVNPIPAKLLREKGADIVIASSVIQPLVKDGQRAETDRRLKMPHFLKIITNIQGMVEARLVKSQLDAIDVMIFTEARVNHALDFARARDIVQDGEAAARACLPSIQAHLQASKN